MLLFRELAQFLAATLKHWLILATGGVIAIVLAAVEHWWGKSLPRRSYFSLMALLLFVALFLGWRDEHRAAEGWRVKGEELQTKLSKAQDRIQKLQAARVGAPPPAARLHWVREYLDVEVLKPSEPNRLKLMVQPISASLSLGPARLKLTCDRPLAELVTQVKMTMSGQEVVGGSWRVIGDGRAIELTFEGPVLDVSNPLTVEIYSKAPVRALGIEWWGE